ncbi:hypothetical protein [Pseudarthrobacter sp. PH31-O2]|uniref:hypothetical protein n=1 Tax=Pseudarthrobacter sp. PH31-O2 TaxID=3046206 RepID=UPI0024B9DC24|nr:hypothetical protein [Pseudarthrobacter sp. PH31-O2]MDJ0351438.1 hypothetical protein [Pseudarthrobacter sp. PH31-O2]
MKLRPAPLALGLLFAAGTAGCSGSAPTPCPALAWFNSLSVTLDGNSQLVSLVEFCAEDVCSVRYAAGGGVLARREVQLDWTRVGGSEACGGPATAGPVRLTI